MIKSIKSKIIRSIKNKRLNVFLVFLLLAFIILLITKLSKSYTNTIAFKIEKMNVPDEKVILRDSDSILNITLRTYGFKWLDFYLQQPTLKIDFSKDVALTNTKYIWTKSKTNMFNSNRFNNKVSILNMYPDTLVFNFDDNEVKMVPVKLNTNITYAQGFDVFEGYETFPDSVKIIGPKSVVTTVQEIETEAVNLEAVKSDISQILKLKVPEDQKGIKLSKSSVSFKANVERFTEGSVKVPLTILNVPEGLKLKYFPKEITVTFYTSLEKFKSVKPNDFKVVCDFSKVNKEQSFFIPELVKQSEFAKGVKINKQHIEFIVLE